MEKIIKRNKLTLKSKLGVGKNPKLLVHTVSVFHENTDQIIKERIENTGVKFDCKKGCGLCCHLKVEIFPPEAFRIANFVKTMPAEKMQNFIQKLREQANYARETHYSKYSRPCAFLSEEGVCEIYSVRPHNCRAYLSKSFAACETTRNADEDRGLKAAEEKLKADSVDIYQSKKCVMDGAEFGESVLMAIEDESLQEQWANGRHVFPIMLERRQPAPNK